MNITVYPLQDNFKTTLSQQWTGGTGTIYVASTPSFTFPASTTTYIVVSPGKTTMQIAKINAYDATAKTMTVSSITVNKGASVASTAQTHSVGAEVIISDNYQYWEDIRNSINSKVDGDVQGFPSYTTTNRDLISATNGMQVYNSTTGEMNVYQGGAWVALASGSTQPNASTTVAGKVELATQAEFDAGTATGGTGASLVSTPDFTQKQINTATAKTTMVGADSFGIADSADSGKIKRVTLTQLLATTDAQATTTTSGVVEKATDAEVVTGTDTARYMDVKQTTDLVLNTGFVASDNLKISADTSRNAVVNGTQAKLKEIQIGDNYSHGGTIRVKFDLIYVPGSWSGTARIYKNGSAVGTNRATTTSWVTHSEDLTFAAGDLIQLYAQTTTDGTTSVRNFQLFFDEVKYAKLGTVITD